ncbi:hypothetical protein, partial [Klebsiella pneumoniae]|uniref:hypothetical protein n=1 Tax=Klebsiella pneumoniae TaxID=573 RepID=UPI0027302A7F
MRPFTSLREVSLRRQPAKLAPLVALQARRGAQRRSLVRLWVSSHVAARHERRPRTEPRLGAAALQAGCCPQGSSFIGTLAAA